MPLIQRVRFAALGLGTAMVVASTSALAVAPTSIEELTASVSFDNVGLAILAVTAAIIPVLLIWKGAKFVTRAIKGA